MLMLMLMLILIRHQTLQHPPYPLWPGPPLRLWRQWRIRHKGRRQHIYWHILLYGPGAYHWPILYHYL